MYNILAKVSSDKLISVISSPSYNELLFPEAFLFFGLVFPLILKPIYILWMSFAVVMGFIVSHIILSLIFGLVFTPAGLLIRLLRKDPLDEKINPQAESYWIKRERKPFDPHTIERQY